MKKIMIALLLLTGPALAATNIVIDKKTQTMTVHSSQGNYTWPVSTARKGYKTPSGFFRPISLQPMHFSRKYHNSPMPHSIFFTGGYAIHGTNAVGHLGHPASHGCVRLAPENASTLYKLVSKDRGNTSIRIQ